MTITEASSNGFAHAAKLQQANSNNIHHNNNNSSTRRRKQLLSHNNSKNMIKDDQRERQLLEDEQPPVASSPDPFRNDMKLNTLDWVILAVGTIFLLPLRAIGVVTSLVLAWAVAKIGLYGLTEEELNSCQLPRASAWRLKLMQWFAIFGRITFWCAGFLVTVKGRQASRSEAPILVGAPHSSFLEALIIIMSGSSPVSRHENRHAFLISACQVFYQTIFVDRRSSEGRKKAIQDICERGLSKDMRLPQVFICPEGTNTNRSVLIQFKVGAFVPGVPVQPVLIRYPGYDSDHDAITWTYLQSHSYLFSVWYLLANPINRVEIEYLPVYNPTEEDKADSERFAKNVQVLMAEALKVPATDITYSSFYEEYCRKNNMLLPEQTQAKPASSRSNNNSNGKKKD